MKRFIALLLALVMAFALCACGGSEAPATDAPAAAPAESGKTEVTVIAAQYGTQTADWWKGFEEKFEAANSDIDLVVEVVAWADINVVVDTRVANGQAPDLLNIDAYMKYYESDLLMPTSEWVSEETFAKFYPSFIAESVDAEGTCWAIPDLATARALYVNKDILAAAGVEKAPTTWSELEDACAKIKAYDPEIYAWGVDMTTDEGQAAFAYYTWNNGGGFVDKDGNWALNSAENVEAIEFIVEMINKGYTNTDPATETRYTLQDMFAAGKVAMMIAPTQLESVCAEAGNGVNFAAALIPCNEGKTNASMGVMDRIMCFDNDHSAEKLAAITAVVDAFYDDQPYAEWVVMENFIPATSTGGEICIQLQPELEAWINIVSGAQFYPAAKAEWMDVKQGVIDVQQKALQGGNVKELLDNLQKQIAG